MHDLKPQSNTPTRNKILLVEDEPENMIILSTFLREANYDVTEAPNGQEAFDVLQGGKAFDLIVTDRRMPHMDGLTLAKKVKADARFAKIPVIMQTGDHSQDAITEGIKAGVFYYLTKPYEEETLLAIVRSAIQKQKQTASFEQRMTRQRDALGTFVQGEFEVQTPEQAQNVALLLAGVYKRPELAVTGLYELILNGIEHGNLGLGYDAKGRLLSDGTYDQEIARRLQLPENAAKKVTISFSQKGKEIEVTVKDQGPGFDWRPFMEIEPSRATNGNGRGIAKANLISFDSLQYIDKGNAVKVVSKL